MAIEFLTAEGSSPIKIHRRTRIANGEDSEYVSSVRWSKGHPWQTRSASTKSSTRPAYGLPRKGGKTVFIMKETLLKSFKLCEACTHYIFKFHCNCNWSFKKKKKELFFIPTLVLKCYLRQLTIDISCAIDCNIFGETLISFNLCFIYN
jgi:hypothetical protein